MQIVNLLIANLVVGSASALWVPSFLRRDIPSVLANMRKTDNSSLSLRGSLDKYDGTDDSAWTLSQYFMEISMDDTYKDANDETQWDNFNGGAVREYWQNTLVPDLCEASSAYVRARAQFEARRKVNDIREVLARSRQRSTLMSDALIKASHPDQKTGIRRGKNDLDYCWARAQQGYA